MVFALASLFVSIIKSQHGSSGFARLSLILVLRFYVHTLVQGVFPCKTWHSVAPCGASLQFSSPIKMIFMIHLYIPR